MGKNILLHKNDPSIGGMSTTGILETAWDDVATQVAKDVALRLKDI